jgi:hypothetical protein
MVRRRSIIDAILLVMPASGAALSDAPWEHISAVLAAGLTARCAS